MKDKNHYKVDSSTGIWSGDQTSEDIYGHNEDPGLMNAIVKIIKQKKCSSIYDFGCGMGGYTKFFKKSGLKVEGFDGNPDTEKMTAGLGKCLDLSKPFNLGQKFDYVMSLEVGEHIPKQYESQFIENIHNHNSKGVILSWAILNPFQKGIGHVNNQDNDYIVKLFTDRGYKHDLESQSYLRENCSKAWFPASLMTFER
tara:strand:+ start:916 stop:1509 length:594 start_codon:yes stop_codon:yes gene_type:complete